MKRFIFALLVAAVACSQPVSTPTIRASTATARGPLNPTSWTVPQWYVDPANISGNASDNNSCTTTATPCKTWNEINAGRWGCIGSPTACPVLLQPTNITFLSSHTDGTDPVVFLPGIGVGGNAVLQGTTPTTVATVSISGTTAKSTAAGTNSLLITNLGASGATKQLLTNTTHPSRAWAYKSLGANSFDITQPFVPLTIPNTTNALPVEVNSWVDTDSVTLQSVVSVNLVQYSPIQLFSNSFLNANANAAYLYQLNIFAPTASAPVTIGAGVRVNECSSDRVVQGGTSLGFASMFLVNAMLNTGVIVQATATQIWGGSASSIFSIGSSSNSNDIGGAIIGSDFIMGASVDHTLQGNVSIQGAIYLDQSLTIPSGVVEMAPSTGGLFYGGASANVFLVNNAHFRLRTSTFTATFTAPQLVNTGISLDGASTACSSTGGATPSIACGIATTVANLDAAAGAAGFGKNAFVLGGASVSNF